jgi:hypothetical protein
VQYLCYVEFETKVLRKTFVKNDFGQTCALRRIKKFVSTSNGFTWRILEIKFIR